MINELLLVGSVALIFGATLLSYKIFGKTGLYCISVIATILANVEATILVNAFGMEQTLGNVLFAATFLITDILSECEGKKEANRAVWLGIFSSIFFLLLTQSWLLYTPAESNLELFSGIKTVFSNTPRMIISSLIVYAISQLFDVWLYHKWWAFTEKRCGNKRKFLWLRNNGSTLISQILNTLLFTLFAFWGVYEAKTLISIFISSYIIFIFTSLIDTPFVYLARKIHDDKVKKLHKTASNDK